MNYHPYETAERCALANRTLRLRARAQQVAVKGEMDFNAFVHGRVYGDREAFHAYYAAAIGAGAAFPFMALAQWVDLLDKFVADQDAADLRDTQAAAVAPSVQGEYAAGDSAVWMEED